MPAAEQAAMTHQASEVGTSTAKKSRSASTCRPSVKTSAKAATMPQTQGLTLRRSTPRSTSMTIPRPTAVATTTAALRPWITDRSSGPRTIR